MVAVSIQFRVMDSWVQCSPSVSRDNFEQVVNTLVFSYNTIHYETKGGRWNLQYNTKYSQFEYHHRSSYRNTTISHWPVVHQPISSGLGSRFQQGLCICSPLGVSISQDSFAECPRSSLQLVGGRLSLVTTNIVRDLVAQYQLTSRSRLASYRGLL